MENKELESLCHLKARSNTHAYTHYEARSLSLCCLCADGNVESFTCSDTSLFHGWCLRTGLTCSDEPFAGQIYSVESDAL